MKICDKAKTCHSAPSCQHGRPHKEITDCQCVLCHIGGRVSCVDEEKSKAEKNGKA